MEIIAKSKFVRQRPRKLRLVAGEVRGLKAEEAMILLENLNRRAAKAILLVLKQGIGNAVNNFNLKKEDLKIKALEIGEGPRYKRMDKSHRFFRWGTIQKRTSHIRMILEGEEEQVKKAKKVKKEKRVKKEKKGAKDGS